MKDWKKCPCCEWNAHATSNEFLRHVLACEAADPPVKASAQQLLDARTKKANEPILCCKLRKKIETVLVLLSEEASGIPDSELADVMTFEKSPNGNPVAVFRFCPWCGVKWVRSGAFSE